MKTETILLEGKTLKLGRVKSQYDPRNLRLRSYLPRYLAPVPDQVDWSKEPVKNLGVLFGGWGMMKNDSLGCCAIADPGHGIMVWTGNVGHVQRPSDDDIVKGYEAWGDFNPKDPINTDSGCDMLTVAKGMRDTGLGGHKTAAFVSFSPVDLWIKNAIYLFEGCSIGFGLPATIQGMGRTWDIPAGQKLDGDWEPYSAGGHAVRAVSYDSKGVYFISWGEIYFASWAFMHAYVDEGIGHLSPEALDGKTGLAANGFDLAALQSDLANIPAKA